MKKLSTANVLKINFDLTARTQREELTKIMNIYTYFHDTMLMLSNITIARALLDKQMHF